MGSATAGRRAAVAASIALVTITAALAATLAGAGPSPAAAAVQESPNVVLIESDDQTQEEMRFLPKTAHLIGDRGATFGLNLAVWPLCCPSRATLFTGQYPHNHGVLGNKGAPYGGFPRFHNETALPVWLSNAGYYTAHIGKFLNGYEESPIGVPPGWSEWHGSKDTYRYYGYELLEDGQWVQYGDKQENPNAPADPSSYSTDVYTDKAIRIIDQRAPSDQPFFLSVGYLAPHGGGPNSVPGPCVSSAKPARRDLLDAVALPPYEPPSYNEKNVSDKPQEIQDLPRMGTKAIARATRNYRCRAGALFDLDRGVKHIINALRDTGELDNTIVIFTSDNGFFHGEHRIVAGKNRVYEEAVRVPLLMRGPGIPRGVDVKSMAANIDLAPTIADVTGAEPLVKVDGRSLMPLAAHADRYRGREILLEQYSGLGEAGEPDTGVYKAVRTQRYKYVENATGEKELYDLRTDPYELKNRVAKEKFADVVRALHRQLTHLGDCAGSGCRRLPAMRLDVKAKRRGGDAHNCLQAHRFVARIPRGKRQTEMTQATFRVDGREAGVDDRAPFKLRLRPRLLRGGPAGRGRGRRRAHRRAHPHRPPPVQDLRLSGGPGARIGSRW